MSKPIKSYSVTLGFTPKGCLYLSMASVAAVLQTKYVWIILLALGLVHCIRFEVEH